MKLIHALIALLLGWLLKKNSDLEQANQTLTGKLESTITSHAQEQTAQEAANETKPSNFVTLDNGLDFTSFNNRP